MPTYIPNSCTAALLLPSPRPVSRVCPGSGACVVVHEVELVVLVKVDFPARGQGLRRAVRPVSRNLVPIPATDVAFFVLRLVQVGASVYGICI